MSRDGADWSMRSLRSRWRTVSLTGGWRFPSDWGVPEVDDVCAAVVTGGDLVGALRDLARARAYAGVGLEEALADLAALCAVLEAPSGTRAAADPDATPPALLRATAVAWADAALGRQYAPEPTDPLSGQATADYLRVRLGEVYARGRRDGVCPSDRYVLLVVTLDLSGVVGWPRLMAMMLVGDVLRSVFDGGESVAVLGSSVAVVLAEREPRLAGRTADAHTLIADRLAIDTDLGRCAPPEIRVEPLPTTEPAALRLVHEVSRA
ncbi:GGDEF domain-containing protein [Actinokineospora auranticolor]|uniref:GGDEF domain-containing protein n=1 Tax=Actinokineospora auranticolor TaxID=155976 RepID=A0A2S6GX72_9PSEU|nr:GGDEF domain-containing protein [Actinokineospora auranticolor]PPK69786.1 hypothetical protein CLV40_103396 [Actinokineospora auranticolor]